jgi:hypothetical protein
MMDSYRHTVLMTSIQNVSSTQHSNDTMQQSSLGVCQCACGMNQMNDLAYPTRVLLRSGFHIQTPMHVPFYVLHLVSSDAMLCLNHKAACTCCDKNQDRHSKRQQRTCMAVCGAQQRSSYRGEAAGQHQKGGYT